MTDHDHQHGHDHDHKHGHGHHAHPAGHGRKALHKDWRAWVVVGLMLAAMAAYVLSMDESLQPVGPAGAPMPAAPPPAE